MPSDPQLRDFQSVVVTLGGDPDLARARAMQLRDQDESLGVADAYLLVLRELCDGHV